MTIWPSNSTKETGWGHTKEPASAPHEIFLSNPNMHSCTLMLQCPTKQPRPTHASLFEILTSGILAGIDIWLSGLEHHNKLKHVIS